MFCTRETLGATIGIEKTLLETVQKANKLALYSAQICVGSPMVFKRKQITDKDVNSANEYLKKNTIHLFSHLPYVYNFAGSKKEGKLNWNGDKEQDSKINNAIKNVEYELSVISGACKDTKCKNGCVLHIGSWTNKQKGLDTVVKSIDKINFPQGSTLLLETMVGKGGVLGTTFEDLKYVYDNTINKDNVKICLDTCHVFANGNYDLRKMVDVERMFKEFNTVFENDELLGLVHLNDSEQPYNSKKDEHALIGQGYIWGENNKPVLVRLLDKIDEMGIPTTLETHYNDYAVIQGL